MCDEEYKDEEKAEIEITPAMLEAGVSVVWSELTGAELPPDFRPDALASRVFLAMSLACARSE